MKKGSKTKNSKVTPHNDTNFKEYNNDIRNIKKLSEEKIDDINNMTDGEKIEIIKTFNETISILQQNLETCLKDDKR